ncbi:50S ribosomal protein L28 [Candidatus Falkowbacteria bacterium CG10_big_fil_rev_8_21_14_0_10_39_11]|uniref:Large ribosomal subunit protein bL28 n=1 Tax=Candidatus Falkowbacteria bacterium CG10_big_fil_rev_8_21_14_0_10_39_11 TaxID=1974565 RepID=A0A2H0V5J7_9BACT|nr:MAG: 50S ribosomal protein L28 [Candidatus Falkowbacteria bacterium CG10_big_fil_rev_8_21_14_0_10_39_11]
MSKVCQICERGPVSSQKTSHANNKSKRTLNINLQSKKVEGGKVKICTKCLKTLNKVSA